MERADRIRGLWRSVRVGAWLAHPNALVAARMWAYLALPVLLVMMAAYLDAGLTNGHGKPLGEDFINYWMGARFALAGDGAKVYDFTAFLAAEAEAAGAPLEPYHYSYPPILLVLTLPLAALPFVPALAAWTIAGLAATYAQLRLLLSRRHAVLALAAAPATFINILHGQNGFLTCACLGGGLLALGRHPLLAGALFGALSYKPHLGILLPVALACAGRWRAFAAAAATVAAVALGSAALAGGEAWSAFAARMDMMSSVILAHGGETLWHRMPTAYVTARLLGVDAHMAWAVQAPVTLAAAAAVAWVWRRPELPGVKAANLVLAAFLATPYLWDYDMVVAVVVLAWRIQEGRWKPWEASALTMVVVSPFLVASSVKLIGVSVGPPLFAFALWAVSRPGPETFALRRT